jgi:hypothetical protein
MASAAVGPERGPEIACDVEQMRGVTRGLRAKPQHLVVTRAFAFGSHVRRGDPDERVEPIQRTGRLRHQLNAAVAGADVHALHLWHLHCCTRATCTCCTRVIRVTSATCVSNPSGMAGISGATSGATTTAISAACQPDVASPPSPVASARVNHIHNLPLPARQRVRIVCHVPDC